MKQEVNVKEVWESQTGIERRILIKTTIGGVVTRNIATGEVRHWPPGEVTDYIFQTLRLHYGESAGEKHTVKCRLCGAEFKVDAIAPVYYGQCGNCPKPVWPLEVLTKVSYAQEGSVVMNQVKPDGTEADTWHTYPARQGQGASGWTCEGFRFKEDQTRVYPNAQGWVRPGGPMQYGISMVKDATYSVRTTATHAAWQR